MNVAIPLITAVVSLLFAATVLEQYLERRRAYQLVWTAGLLLYSMASLMGSLREVYGTSEPVFRTWYFTGAMLVPAYLGMGTIYLVAGRRLAHGTMTALAVLTVAAASLVYLLPLEQPLSNLPAGEPLTGRGFVPPAGRVVAVFMNISGTLAFVGGALYTAWRYGRRRAMGYRVLATALIAAGGLIAAAGGALEAVGLPEPHALALLVGVVVIYAGFLRSRESFALPRLPFPRSTA